MLRSTSRNLKHQKKRRVWEEFNEYISLNSMYKTILLFNLAASQPATEWKTWLISSLTVILAVGAGVAAVCVIQAKRRVRVPSLNI